MKATNRCKNARVHNTVCYKAKCERPDCKKKYLRKLELARISHNRVNKDMKVRDEIDPNSIYVRFILFGQQEAKCGLCGVKADLRSFVADHIIPKSKGGKSTLNNLQLTHHICNSIKGDKTQEQARRAIKEYFLRLGI